MIDWIKSIFKQNQIKKSKTEEVPRFKPSGLLYTEDWCGSSVIFKTRAGSHSTVGRPEFSSKKDYINQYPYTPIEVFPVVDSLNTPSFDYSSPSFDSSPSIDFGGGSFGGGGSGDNW